MLTHLDILQRSQSRALPPAELEAARAKDAAGVPLPQNDPYFPTTPEAFQNDLRNNQRFIEGRWQRLKILARDRRDWRSATMNADTTHKQRFAYGRWDHAENEMWVQIDCLKLYRDRRDALREEHRRLFGAELAA